MPQNITLYNLLISCPSDVKSEVDLIKSSVDEFNDLYTEPLGISIKTRHWSKSSYAQSGGKPQALLNEQFVTKCDAAVAIFWTKFGSPTDEYGSGTEEEIEIMLQSGKQVFMYFSDKPVSPSQMSDDGYKKVQAFREKYKDRGVYFTYSSDEEFKKLFFAHLSMHFLSEKKVKETTDERVSKLKLMGIDENGMLSEEASVYPFVLNTQTTMLEFRDIIGSKFQEIAGMNVGKRTTVNNPLLADFTSPIEVDETERKIITVVAEQLELGLPAEFFDLGNLGKDVLTSNPFNGLQLKGTSEEQYKYRAIKELYEIISNALEWAPVEKAFSDKHCVKLAIQNCGKAIDEDVEITFEIAQAALETLSDFPTFKNEEMSYLLNDCDMSMLFGISSTADYIDYSESMKTQRSYVPHSVSLPGRAPNYSEDFSAELENVFCYSIYPNGDSYTVKLKVDYIKHNTTVAFPSVLFIKDRVTEIPYKITSKNNPDIVEGILKIHDSDC